MWTCLRFLPLSRRATAGAGGSLSPDGRRTRRPRKSNASGPSSSSPSFSLPAWFAGPATSSAASLAVAEFAASANDASSAAVPARTDASPARGRRAAPDGGVAQAVREVAHRLPAARRVHVIIPPLTILQQTCLRRAAATACWARRICAGIGMPQLRARRTNKGLLFVIIICVIIIRALGRHTAAFFRSSGLDSAVFIFGTNGVFVGGIFFCLCVQKTP